MSAKTDNPSIRILPDDVANKIAAGEVVERPASVVKELVENALDAQATRITVRLVGAGQRMIEITDNGHGMSEQNALLAIERHATSKIRNAEDLEGVRTMGFRGEALASMAAVSRFVLLTRRAKDDHATKVQVDGGILRGVEAAPGPVGTKITVNRLYFNTPVRAKFLKGITTELSHCIDAVQRHALARESVGFQMFHNDKLLLDIPEHASLKERVALIWGLHFAQDMIEIQGEQAGFKMRGVIGLPGLTRAARSHQFFFMNQRPVVNRALQYGLEEGYRGLVTIGRHPVGVMLLETHPRFVDVNIHPTKREIRFRDERAVRDAIRDVVRQRLAETRRQDEATIAPPPSPPPAPELFDGPEARPEASRPRTDDAPATTPERREDAATPIDAPKPLPTSPQPPAPEWPRPEHPSSPMPETTASPRPNGIGERVDGEGDADTTPAPPVTVRSEGRFLPGLGIPEQTEFVERTQGIAPEAVYERINSLRDAPLQLFDTYLLVPNNDRLLIIDQHALHERLNYDSLLQELSDSGYESQQLAVPIVVDVAPSQVRLVEKNLQVFRKLGIELEHFGGNTFQITALCHLYDDGLVRDAFYAVLDALGQGDLFDHEHFLAETLRLASRACKASIRAGDRLTDQERRNLLEGFERLRPPYTCPHGRPIIVELTQRQMEKSFKRIQ